MSKQTSAAPVAAPTPTSPETAPAAMTHDVIGPKGDVLTTIEGDRRAATAWMVENRALLAKGECFFVITNNAWPYKPKTPTGVAGSGGPRVKLSPEEKAQRAAERKAAVIERRAKKRAEIDARKAERARVNAEKRAAKEAAKAARASGSQVVTSKGGARIVVKASGATTSQLQAFHNARLRVEAQKAAAKKAK